MIVKYFGLAVYADVIDVNSLSCSHRAAFWLFLCTLQAITLKKKDKFFLQNIFTGFIFNAPNSNMGDYICG